MSDEIRAIIKRLNVTVCGRSDATAAELASRLLIDKTTISKWIERGFIPDSVKIGLSLRFSLSLQDLCTADEFANPRIGFGSTRRGKPRRGEYVSHRGGG